MTSNLLIYKYVAVKMGIPTFCLKVNILVGSFMTSWFSFVDMEMTLKVYLSLKLIQNIQVYSQA